MARNPERIYPFMAKLTKLWESMPDIRFGQMMTAIEAVAQDKLNVTDLFYVEDDKLEALFTEWQENREVAACAKFLQAHPHADFQDARAATGATCSTHRFYEELFKIVRPCSACGTWTPVKKIHQIGEDWECDDCIYLDVHQD